MTDGDYALALSLFFVSYNLASPIVLLRSKSDILMLRFASVKYRESTTANYCLAHECLRANLMMKKLRPRVWLSLIVTLFGITVSRILFSFLNVTQVRAQMIGMGLIETFGGLIAMRVLLGVFEAGVSNFVFMLRNLLIRDQLFPGAAYLLSLWYPRSLLQFRIAM